MSEMRKYLTSKGNMKFYHFLQCKYFEIGKNFFLSLSKQIMRCNYSNFTAQLQIQAHGRCVGSPAWLTRDGGFIEPKPGSSPGLNTAAATVRYVTKNTSSYYYISSDSTPWFFTQKVIHCLISPPARKLYPVLNLNLPQTIFEVPNFCFLFVSNKRASLDFSYLFCMQVSILGTWVILIFLSMS